MSKEAKRLFEQFQPEHYELLLEPDAHSLSFSGRVIIHGKKTGRPSKRITFHQKGLKITSAQIIKHDKKGEQEITVARINNQNSMYEVRLHANELLFPGEYTIKLEFSGKITPALAGIYPARYKYKGKDQIILVTQFESHHAREAFPCIDEPEAKATFDLSVTAPKEDVVLSNTPEASAHNRGKFSTHTFEPTPKMSAYLLAFVMGNLHYTEAISKSGVTVRSWASVAQPKETLEYATKEGADVLDFFADYFATPYPLKKLDQVALPDFEAGAMENWGLITYREVVLLTDPVNRSISSEQFATQVIAHELSHQWFGNLVTMKWWDDLWLNESFAGLMEHVAPAALHPEWQQWESYAIQDIPLITSRDSYKDIQPVSIEVSDPDLISTIFDPAIVYAKGARLLKMMIEYIGEETFLKGLKLYFETHAYGSTVRNDLWQALSEASGKDIDALMTPWLIQSGLPVVHVKQTGKTINVHQERFMLDNPPDETLWPIPLLADSPVKPDLFADQTAEVQLSNDKFAVINHNGSGMYITHYQTPEHRQYIAKLLSKQSLPTEARVNIFNDIYMLTRHGDASLTDGLDMVLACITESRDSVWGVMLRTVGAASQLTEGNKTTEEQIKKLRISLMNATYNKLGWDDQEKDDSNDKQLRHTAIASMIAGEEPGTIKEALKRYKAAKGNLQVIQAEIRNTILAAVVRHGDKSVIKRLIDNYDSSSMDIQSDITSALASTKNLATATRVLGQALGPKGFVRSQDVMRWLALFLRNHHVREAAWDFMVNNWDWLEETLKDTKSFDYLPVYASGVIASPDWAKKYRDLFEPMLSNKLLERNIKIGLADIDARLAWRKRDEAAVIKWLADFTKDQAKSS